jgi:hypothetical protein
MLNMPAPAPAWLLPQTPAAFRVSGTVVLGLQNFGVQNPGFWRTGGPAPVTIDLPSMCRILHHAMCSCRCDGQATDLTGLP